MVRTKRRRSHGQSAGLSFQQFVWLWNRSQGQTTPRLHLDIAAWLGKRWLGGDRRLLLLCFRSAGKSTLIGMFCAWLLFNQPSLRILILSAEYELAKKMVRNVKNIVERHPLNNRSDSRAQSSMGIGSVHGPTQTDPPGSVSSRTWRNL